MMTIIFLGLLLTTYAENGCEDTRQEHSTKFYEKTPSTPAAVNSKTSSDSQSTKNSILPTATNVTNEISSAEKELRCLILPLQKSNSRIVVERISYKNPVENFEENITRSAAALIKKWRFYGEVSAKIEGVEVKLKLLSSRSGTTPVNLGEDKDGDMIELDNRVLTDTHLKAVLVVASLKKDILEDSGVYNASLAENPETTSYYDSENFVDASTSILSVSVFQATIGGDLKRKSVSATTVFDIRNDDSEARIARNDPGRRVTEATRRCVSFDNNRRWSVTGCKILINESSVRCDCNHTTSFAVMVSLKSFKMPEWENQLILIAELIGVIFLFLTLCMLLWLRKSLKKDRILIQINLTLALFLMHVSMLVSGFVASVQALCILITFTSHFFMISSAMWMVNEGYVLYKKTGSTALKFDISKLKIRLILMAWVVPGVYSSFCLGFGLGLKKYIDTTIGYDAVLKRMNKSLDDMKYETCWLGTRSKMVLAGLIPIVACTCCAIFFLIRVSVVIWRMNVQAQYMAPSGAQKNHDALKSTTRAVALLVPVLGVPWIFAIMVNMPGTELVFAAIHGVANGLQGVFLFIIYFVANQDARKSAKTGIFNAVFAPVGAFGHSFLTSSTSRSNRSSSGTGLFTSQKQSSERSSEQRQQKEKKTETTCSTSSF